MTFTVAVPAAAIAVGSLTDLLSGLRHPTVRLRPFDRRVIDFCAQFSTALFRDSEARRYPEIQALAYWMRRSELLRMADGFASLEDSSVVLAPRGLVFHVAAVPMSTQSSCIHGFCPS